jgi:hypothetical protein
MTTIRPTAVWKLRPCNSVDTFQLSGRNFYLIRDGGEEGSTFCQKVGIGLRKYKAL